MRRWLLFGILLAGEANAQLFTDDGAAITVQSGAQLTVEGSLRASNVATIADDGIIDLSGDLTNDTDNDLFGTSQGTVVLNGAGQSVGGASVTRFNNLTVSTGPVTLTQDIATGGFPAPAGVLSLGPSKLFLNTHKLFVLNPAPGAITRTTGFLVSETDPLAGYGEVQWFIGASAPGTYVFPFGNAVSDHYLPVVINTMTAGSDASGSITCATYPTDALAAPNNRPLPSGLPVLTDLSGTENAPNVLDRFWPMRSDDYATPPAALITFTYRDSEWNTGTNTIAEPLLQAQRFDGSTWSAPPSGVASVTANSVTTSITNAYGQVWALVQSSMPLPVELLFFDAEPEGDVVQCAWTTASETNNDYFTVERSADGQAFEDVGEVDGAGTSLGERHYTFPDPSPLPGLSYYRLRQTDFDGTEQRSDVVAVWRDAPDAQLVVYPNPCANELHVAGAIAGGPMRILDATGRVVLRIPSQRMGSIDVSTLPAGAYVLVFGDDAAGGTARFVKHQP